MDARQQDPRARAGTGWREAAAAPPAAGGASKSIGFAELLAVAAGLGGLYLLVRLRTEASAAERDELAVHEHAAPEPHAPTPRQRRSSSSARTARPISSRSRCRTSVPETAS